MVHASAVGAYGTPPPGVCPTYHHTRPRRGGGAVKFGSAEREGVSAGAQHFGAESGRDSLCAAVERGARARAAVVGGEPSHSLEGRGAGRGSWGRTKAHAVKHHSYAKQSVKDNKGALEEDMVPESAPAATSGSGRRRTSRSAECPRCAHSSKWRHPAPRSVGGSGTASCLGLRRHQASQALCCQTMCLYVYVRARFIGGDWISGCNVQYGFGSDSRHAHSTP